MGVLRTVAVGFFALLLTVNLVAANAAVATERTVLNPEFVKNSLEEEGAYGAGQTMIVEAATEQMSSAGPVEELPVSVEEIVADVVTREYLADQVGSNVDSTLAYLHGNRDDLELVVDLRPVKRGLGDAVARSIDNMTVTEMIDLVGSQTDEDISIEARGVSLDVTAIGEMAESRESYRDVRQSFRADVRELVIDEIVNESFRGASNDELLALVIEDYDPDEYSESEKEAMVDDREAEIRAELRSRIVEEEGDRIDEEIDEQLSEISGSLESEAEDAIGDGDADGNASITEPAVDMLLVGVRGLTTDMTYDEYRDGIDRSKADLAENVSAYAVDSMSEEIPDRLDLAEEMDPGAREQFTTARQAVVWFDRGAVALPLLVLVLIGLLYLVSRSQAVTAFAAGSSLLIAGLVGFVVAQQVPQLIENAVSSTGDGEVDPIVDVVVGIVDGIVGTLGAQSLALVALGVVGIALGVYLRTYGEVEIGGDGGQGGDAAQ